MKVTEDVNVRLPTGGSTTSLDERRRGGRPSPNQVPFLFLVLEGERLLAGGARFSLGGVIEVVVLKGTERAVSRERIPGGIRLVLRLSSRFMSREHARIRATPAGWLAEDAGSTNGIFLNGSKVPFGLVGPGDLIEMGRAFFKIDQLAVDDSTEDSTDIEGSPLEQVPVAFQTLLPTLASDLKSLATVVRSRLSLTIIGEPGTGKEVLSRAIHGQSRGAGPFVAVNCSAVPATLVESELFGHVKGAFSGAASDKIGHVRAAHGGTLLLDEIISAVPGLQQALLRVIQEGEVTPLGSSRPARVDVRFLAASQRSLDDAVAADTFRGDLRDRLKGYTFTLPPLRDRMVDMGLLVAHLLTKQGIEEKQQPRMEPDAALRYLRHRWPGNIRELELVLQSSWALSENGLISESRIHGLPAAAVGATGAPEMDKAELRRWLTESLRVCAGNVSKTAERMGRNRTLVHRWLKDWEINPEDFRR